MLKAFILRQGCKSALLNSAGNRSREYLEHSKSKENVFLTGGKATAQGIFT